MTQDSLLYGRWRKTRDSEAFREIVERHLGMVYSTARRILANREDAEEVAQECFEQLALEKTSVRDNLAGWLYRSAANRALNRMRSESARKAREHRYAENEKSAPDPAWPDIYGYVDDALAAIPDDLRSVIVLRYFEQLSNDEAAKALGVSPNTVTNRVKRGVEEIRRRLRNQGIVAGASLVTALTSLKSEAAPSNVVISVNKIGLAGWAGGATVTSSVLGSLILMNTKVIIGCTVLGLVLAGFGFFAMRGAKPAPTPAPTPRVTPVAKAEVVKTVAPPPESGADTPVVAAARKTTGSQTQTKKPTIATLLALSRSDLKRVLKLYAPIREAASISGAVLDRDGYAIAGASVLLTPAEGWGRLPRVGKLSRAVTSGADGSYLIDGIKNGGRYWVNATKTGYAEGAQGGVAQMPIQIKSGTHATNIDFKLDRGVTLRGQVVSASGTPVPDGIVQRIRVSGPNTIPGLRRYSARTNGDGYFSMGFDRKVRGDVASLRVQSAQYGSASFPDVVIQDDHVVVLRLTAPAIIHGTVRDTNGKPVSDVRLFFTGEKSVVVPAEGAGTPSEKPSIAGLFSAICDPDGQYAVKVDSGLDYDVEVTPTGPGMNQKGGRVPALEPGEQRVFNVVLDANVITVRGRIIGSPSGKPIDSSMGLVWVFARRRGFDGIVGRAIMNAQGGYELKFPGESGEYTFQASYMSQNGAGEESSPRQLQGGDELNLDLTLPEAQYFSVHVVDTGGNPIAGASVGAFMGGGSTLTTNRKTNKDGRLDAPVSMPPNSAAQLFVEKPGYATARGTLFADQSPGTVHPEETIVLRPGAGFEGNVVDADGNPLASVKLSISVTDRDGKAWALKTSTDTSGHFTVVDRAPAGVVDIAISAGAGGGTWSTKQLQLQADAITELGNITLK